MESLTVLPKEMEQLAAQLPESTNTEVQRVINLVFDAVGKLKNDLAMIKVEDEFDTESMAKAREIRLEVRRKRLAAEKEFDEKRESLKLAMSAFKTEDTLWLRAKQIMEATTKQIETDAEILEKTKERIESERKQQRTAARMQELAELGASPMVFEYENMGEETWQNYISGLRAKKEAADKAAREAEEARLEEERKQREEQERIRQENERLRKEAAAKEAELAAERARVERERREAEAKAAAERAEADRKLREAEAKRQAELAAEREKLRAMEAEKARLENEAKAKAKAEADRIEAENKARQEAERKAAAAPDKEKLLAFERDIAAVMLPNVRTMEAAEIVGKVQANLKAIRNYILDKANQL